MNTGIQDSANLGWKLALVCRGLARPSLLDSYDAERRPVGEYVLRFTDRAFSVATSTRPLARLVRAHVAPRLVPVVLRFSYGRALAFRTVSQLGVRYRSSPAVQPTGRRLQRSPRPGDRLPDARLQVDGRESWLHAEVAAPALHLLLFGDGDRWDAAAADALAARYASVLKIVRIDRAPRPGVLHDRDGLVFRQLHIRNCATILLRPDGYLAARTDGVGLDHARRYLERWLAASLLDGSAARCGP